VPPDLDRGLANTRGAAIRDSTLSHRAPDSLQGRHVPDPAFHPDDLRKPLDAPRNLPGIDFRADEQLKLLQSFDYQEDILRNFGNEEPVMLQGLRFQIKNPAFRQGDVELYYSIIRHYKPSRIMEIGSGMSTAIALQAVEDNEKEKPGYHCDVTAIEPYPWYRHEKLKLLVERVEDVDLSRFAQLGEGDILFIDSSHMIRPQGDVLNEFLEILPILNRGVIVHVHDVFTPRDYLTRWLKHEHFFWNEQYLLEAFLSCNDRFKVLLAPNYLQIHHPAELLAACPLLAKAPEMQAHSFWMECVAPKRNGTG